MKVVTEEEATKKFASKQWKGKKVKKKATSEKPSSECPLNPSLLQEKVPNEVDPLAENVVLVSDDQLLTISTDASLVAPEFGMDVGV